METKNYNDFPDMIKEFKTEEMKREFCEKRERRIRRMRNLGKFVLTGIEMYTKIKGVKK